MAVGVLCTNTVAYTGLYWVLQSAVGAGVSIVQCHTTNSH